MINPELLNYIGGEINKGTPRDTIKANLQTQGWSSADVEEGFAAMSPAPSASALSLVAATSHSHGKLIAVIVIVILLAGGGFFYMKNKGAHTETAQVETENNLQEPSEINNKEIQMTNLDPQAQELIEKYKAAQLKLSPAAANGNLNNATEEDFAVIDEMDSIYSELLKYDTSNPNVTISVEARGYEVNVTINGKDLGMDNDASGGVRLNYTDSIMALIAPEEVKNKMFVLNKGENTLKITYKKIGEASSALEVVMTAYTGNEEILKITGTEAEGVIERSFTLK